jgi:hypothetical protein
MLLFSQWLSFLVRLFASREYQAASNGEPMIRQLQQIEPNSTDHQSNEKW